MTLLRTTLAAALVAVGFAFSGNTAQAGMFDHIDGLAADLQGYSTKLAREFRDHFRHTPQYRHLAGDAREMRALAAHIHEVAHFGGSLRHIESDLRELDDLFHHIEGLVEEIEHDAYEHGIGHVHGDTDHVHAILHDMEDVMHHMLEDVERLNRPRPGRLRIVGGGFGHGGHGHDDHGHGGHEDDHGHGGHEDDHGHGGHDDDHGHAGGGIGFSIGGGSSRTVIHFGFGN